MAVNRAFGVSRFFLGTAVRTIQTFVEAFAKLRLSLQAPVLRCHARRPSARVMLICSRGIIASTDRAARLDPSCSHSRTRRGVTEAAL